MFEKSGKKLWDYRGRSLLVLGNKCLDVQKMPFTCLLTFVAAAEPTREGQSRSSDPRLNISATA
jgi:hypothetical protein